MPLETGLTASTRLVVADSDTAIALGTGDLPVLGTHPTACPLRGGHLPVFSVVATKRDRKVAEGAVHRAVVDRQHFLDRL